MNPNTPGPNGYGHGFNMYPDAAFKDTTPDKETSGIVGHDIYEIWREILFFTGLGLFTLSLSWWLNVAGMYSTYLTIKWVYYVIHAFVAGGFVYTWRKLGKTQGMSKWERHNLSVWRIRLTDALVGFVFVILIHNLFGA